MSAGARTARCDVLVVGGGLGGVAAALAATRCGASVIMTEESDWIGGQLTSQGVPPDEHPWIESFGCTKSYRAFRNGVRDYYREHYPLKAESRANPTFNPGNASVTKLAHEPRVALAVLQSMIQPQLASGRLEVLLRHRPVEVAMKGDHVMGITFERMDGSRFDIEASFFIDATELGDVLPLAGIDYVTGFESRSETGEPEAPDEAQPANQQAFTMCFAVDHLDGEDHTIDQPSAYEEWRSYRADHWVGPHLGWDVPNPRTLEPQHFLFNPNPPEEHQLVIADESRISQHSDLWVYRRVLARHHYPAGAFPSDICVVNWPMNDYWLGPIVDVTDEERAHHLAAARQLSLSLLYWLQTEAPRLDGGTGFPGLRLRPDVMGSLDGLAKRPYVRESRRIRALRTVTSLDIAKGQNLDPVARFTESVGVGAYRIDIHPSSGGDGYIDLPSRPFEIPLGALLPRRTGNLIAGGKNIGTTHLANGSYRLHPVEWNIGESAGTLAAFCVERRGTTPESVYERPDQFQDYSAVLEQGGVELHWPELQGY